MVHRKLSADIDTRLIYDNGTMRCEALNCDNGVFRVYHPFCARCFRDGILKGKFQSRDGRYYQYSGTRWLKCALTF